MTSAKRIRDSICNIITASVSGVAKKDAEENNVSIESELDAIFHSFSACDGDDDGDELFHCDESDDNVTPLMVACDKSCSGALVYLQNQLDAASLSSIECRQQYPAATAIQVEQLIKAWGHPTEASSCGNTAAHHALSAGFSEGIHLLAGIWDTIEKIKSHDINCKDSDVVQERYTPLLKQTNQNGDTPIMMACVSGHVIAIKSILEKMCKLSLEPPSDNLKNASESIEKTWQSFKDMIFCVKNSEECTALNLACGYGKVVIVKFLIRPQNVGLNTSTREVKLLSNDDDESDAILCIMQKKPLVDVCYSDVQFCQKTVENVASGLKFMKEQNQADRINEFEIELKKAKECMLLLTCELERISAETANELLDDSGGTVVQSLSKDKPNTSNGNSKSKAKKKKRQQRKNTKQHQTHHDKKDSELKAERVGEEDTKNNERAHAIWDNLKNERGVESESQSSNTAPPFITLQDGTVISRAAKADYIPSEPAMNLPFEDSKSNKTNSGAKPKALENILQSSSVTSDNCDVAAIMESLCLDASMLFLSAHGMAIDMSPCQLEAVESILTHQLNATKEAQNIQRRLLDK